MQEVLQLGSSKARIQAQVATSRPHMNHSPLLALEVFSLW